MEQAYKDILTKLVKNNSIKILLQLLFQITENENWDGASRLGSYPKEVVLMQLSTTFVALDAARLFTALCASYEEKAASDCTFDTANIPTYAGEAILDLAEESKRENIANAIRSAGGVAKRPYYPLIAPNRETKGGFGVWMSFISRGEEPISCYRSLAQVQRNINFNGGAIDTDFIGVGILAYAIRKRNSWLAIQILEEIDPAELSEDAHEWLEVLFQHSIDKGKYEFSAFLRDFISTTKPDPEPSVYTDIPRLG